MAVIYIPKTAAKAGVEPCDMHEIINPEYYNIGDNSTVEIEGCHSVK